MSKQCLYTIPPHQRTGWNSLCCHARGIRDRMRDAIVVVYKSSQTKFKRPRRLSATFHLDFWIAMIASLAVPIFIFVQLIDWIERFHYEDDFELGPGVNKHPYFMVTAFGVVMPYAMLTYRVFRVCPYITLMIAHAVLQGLILLLIVVGFIYAIKSHTGTNIPTIPHFYSLHSLVGLLAIFMFLAEFAFGLFCSITHVAGRGEIYKSLHIHRILGLMTYILGFWTIMLGLTQIPYYLFYWLYHEGIEEAIVINYLGLFTAGCFMIVFFATARRKYQLRKGDAELNPFSIFKGGCFKDCGKRKARRKRTKAHGKARCTCNL